VLKIAMPYKGGKVNEHFGSSSEFVIIESISGNITGKEILTNEVMHNHGGLARILKAEGVNVVITGGIGLPMAEALQNEGFILIKGASGDVERVAGEYLKGTLISSVSIGCMCGGKHRHSHGQGR